MPPGFGERLYSLAHISAHGGFQTSSRQQLGMDSIGDSNRQIRPPSRFRAFPKFPTFGGKFGHHLFFRVLSLWPDFPTGCTLVPLNRTGAKSRKNSSFATGGRVM